MAAGWWSGPTFRALSATVVPESLTLRDEEWRELGAIIDQALARRPAAVSRQVALFLRVLNLCALLRYGRTLRGLSPERRYALLHSLERSPVPLLRKGVWGVRTLILMGYYARPAAAQTIGYGATTRGWQAIRD